jgi:anti-sigma-K factor RskA
MNLADREDRAIACAEFVLGTLDEGDQARLLAAMESDESLQREVAFWQDRLLGLYKDLAPVEPSADVWRRIDGGLDRVPVSGPVPAASVGSAATAASRELRSSSESTPRIWQRLGFWRGLSGLALACSLLLSLLFIIRPADPSEPIYVAVLQTADKQAAWIVKVGETGPIRIVPLFEHGPVPQGKAWELWTKGKDASGPTSLGLLAGGATEIPREALPYLGEEQLFEVSLEPEGGSPIGRPTGPVLSLGKTQKI